MKSDFTIVFLGQEPPTTRDSGTRYPYRVEVPIQRPIGFPSASDWPPLKKGQSASSLGIGFVSKQGEKFEAFYGGKQNGLPTFWFSLPASTVPPSWVCLVVKATFPARDHTSNFAETTI